MRRLGFGLAFALGGYVAGGIIGYLLVQAFSGNLHDRDLEAAMTGAFVVGPLVAVIAGIVGAVRGGRSAPRAR
jgi:F0F1-type ATP synthase membrane subunit c/vacuolar-type H+-ATPase subunit K